MTESGLPNDSPGAEPAGNAAQNDVEISTPAVGNKGKGKATHDTSSEDEEDDDEEFDPDKMDDSLEVDSGEGGAEDEDHDDDDGDDGDDDDDAVEADESIDPSEVDPSLISEYGVGNRPRRARKDIDYSSEEALKKAGLDHA